LIKKLIWLILVTSLRFHSIP